MSEPKMTAEERVRECACRVDVLDREPTAVYLDDAIRIAEEHAKAEVEAATAELQQRIEEYQHGLDELWVVLGPLTHPWEIKEAVATLKGDYRALATRLERTESERDELRAGLVMASNAHSRGDADAVSNALTRLGAAQRAGEWHREFVNRAVEAERERDEARADPDVVFVQCNGEDGIHQVHADNLHHMMVAHTALALEAKEVPRG